MTHPNGYQRRGQEFADRLHQRSREAAAEHRKVLTSMATGSLAVFFVALTTKIEPSLTCMQTVTVSFALGFMATAVFLGVFTWYADAQRNFFWAKVEEGKQKSGGPEFDTLSKKWRKRLYLADKFLIVAFLFGITSSVLYLLGRIYKW